MDALVGATVFSKTEKSDSLQVAMKPLLLSNWSSVGGGIGE